MKGKSGRPLRVLYALSSNTDQNLAPHFLPDDVVRQMGWDKHPVSDEERQRWQICETDPTVTAAYSHTEVPELYLRAEALALPLYLQKLFSDQMIVETEPLELVQRLLVTLNTGGKDRKYATRHAAFMPPNGHAGQDAKELGDLLKRIKTFDVLVLPSVLLFTDKERGAPFWSVLASSSWATRCSGMTSGADWFPFCSFRRYNALRSLESSASVIVFPSIQVEERMEIKDSYLTALLRSPHQYRPRDFVESDGVVVADNASSPLSKKWASRIAYVHEPANCHLAPTVLLPDVAPLFQLSSSAQQRFVHDVFTALQSDVTAGRWAVAAGQYFIKGTTSTRSNVAEVVSTAEEALKFMKETHEMGHKLVSDKQQELMRRRALGR